MLPYSKRICIFRLHVVQNYLFNHFALYAQPTLSRIRVDLASPAYLWLGFI